eukprot:SAG31_NODE_2450_length_5668_cov_32.512300_2_plen_82_part_00
MFAMLKQEVDIWLRLIGVTLRPVGSVAKSLVNRRNTAVTGLNLLRVRDEWGLIHLGFSSARDRFRVLAALNSLYSEDAMDW